MKQIFHPTEQSRLSAADIINVTLTTDVNTTLPNFCFFLTYIKKVIKQ